VNFGIVGALLVAAWPAIASAEDYRLVTAPDGVPLNVVEAGSRDAPAILFIHGVGQSHLSWTRQFNSDLARSFHLVAFDLRGHGGSGKPWRAEDYNKACTWADDIAAVMAATDLKRPVMVMWSYGGTIGMHYVRCRGLDNLSALVFAASRAGLYPNPDVNPKIPAASDKMMEPNLVRNLAGADEFTAFLTAAPPAGLAETTRIMNLMYPPYARKANDGRHVLADGTPYRDNTDLIPMLTLPVMFMFGERDMFSSAATAAAATKKLFPSARNITYPAAGHWLFFEAADRFNTDLAAFAADVANRKD
jgi:pimeloyl-ACP methyl ester carboxylesterase